MYLRYTTLKKDGKVHRYWRLVRSVRLGGRVIQQTVAQLGELDARGRFQARALARQLIGEPEQAGLFADGKHHLTVPVDRAPCGGVGACGYARHSGRKPD